MAKEKATELDIQKPLLNIKEVGVLSKALAFTAPTEIAEQFGYPKGTELYLKSIAEDGKFIPTNSLEEAYKLYQTDEITGSIAKTFAKPFGLGVIEIEQERIIQSSEKAE